MATPRRSMLAETGIDGIAIKPVEHRLSLAADLGADLVTVDFEGHEHLPGTAALEQLASERTVRVTVPVRADGFDPLGDDSSLRELPDAVGLVLVAGHPAYLSAEERDRAVGQRLEAAARDATDPWIGTEGIERLALTVGGTQFELLSETTAATVRALRRAGVSVPFAVYAPAVLSTDPDTVLDGVGDYVARRGALGTSHGASHTDARAAGEFRDRLLAACERYALVGDQSDIADRIARLRDAGVDKVIAYPAAGFDD